MFSSLKQRARLFGSEDNPLPKGVRVGSVETTDGLWLRYARWPAETRPSKGTVILLQGRSEYIEKYLETVADLRRKGYGVLSFDWRGQGASDRLLTDRRRGYVEHFNQYLDDLETILTKVALPDCKPPFSIVAHSTGALVALLASPALANRIDRMVLVAPLIKLNNLPISQNALYRLSGIFSFLGFGRTYVARGTARPSDKVFDGNFLTSDRRRFERNKSVLMEHDSLFLGAPTIAWIFAACRAMRAVNEPGFANAVSVPILMVAAGNDHVVDSALVELYGRQMRAGSCLTISGARHEILQERDVYREQLLAAIFSFLPGSETQEDAAVAVGAGE